MYLQAVLVSVNGSSSTISPNWAEIDVKNDKITAVYSLWDDLTRQRRN